MLGGRFKHDMAINPVETDFPAVLFMYGLNQSRDRLHTRWALPLHPSENGFPSTPGKSHTALVSHMSHISSLLSLSHAWSIISSIPGQLIRPATNAGKSMGGSAS
jgi:hypothetical protein